jgi:hypothetical protein
MERLDMKMALLAGFVGLAAAQASADIVNFYSNDFESASKVGEEWVSNPGWGSSANFTGHLGRFAQKTHVLELAAWHPEKPGGDEGSGDGEPGGGNEGPGGPGGGAGGGQGGGRTATTLFTLTFDLFLVDSWDGGFAGQYGPDYFGVRINGQDMLWEPMHSVKLEDNFMLPTTGPVHLGGNSAYKDSIFRDITLNFELARDVETLQIEFIGAPSTNNLNDESWGLDNVRVGAHVVPAPGVLALGAGALGLGLRRRRA